MLDPVIHFAAGIADHTGFTANNVAGAMWVVNHKNEIMDAGGYGSFSSVRGSSLCMLLPEEEGSATLEMRRIFTVPNNYTKGDYPTTVEEYAAPAEQTATFTLPNDALPFEAGQTERTVSLLIMFKGIKDLATNRMPMTIYVTVPDSLIAPETQQPYILDTLVSSINNHKFLKKFLIAEAQNNTASTAFHGKLVIKGRPLSYKIGQWWDFQQVAFETVLTKSYITPTVRTHTKQIILDPVIVQPKMGTGTWQVVADHERRALGYQGTTNMSVIPIVMPSWQTKAGAVYARIANVNINVNYQAADGILRKTNESIYAAIINGAQVGHDAQLAGLVKWFTHLSIRNP